MLTNNFFKPKNLAYINLASFYFCLLFLLFPSITEALESTNIKNAAEEAAVKEELFSFLKSAVEDNSWLKAKSKNELKKSLQKYYTGILLKEIVSNTWDFVKEPTDWYGEPVLEKIVIININSKEAQILAYLSEQEANTNQTIHGKAYYKLQKNSKWKITFAEYRWDQQEQQNNLSKT